MHNLLKKFVAISLCIATIGTQAAESFNACTPPKIHVVFSNGILTDRATAGKSARAVQQRAAVLSNKVIADSGSDADDVTMFYHQGNGLGDFAETFLQKEKESEFSDISFSAKATTFFRVIIGIADGSTLATALIVLAQKTIPPAMLSASQARIDSSVAEDVAVAQGFLKQGDSILVVAHSQGNLYANAALRQLYGALPSSQVDSRVVLLGTANPAHGIVGKGGVATDTNYDTTYTDMVINGVRLAAVALGQLQPSPSNVAGVSTEKTLSDFLTQHSFTGVYFNESLDSGKKTVQLMSDGLTLLSNSLNPTSLPSDVAYTFSTKLTYAVSLAELFDGGSSIDVPQVGPYAGSFRSRVVSVSDKTMSFETDVLCSMASTLPNSSNPLTVGLAMPLEAGIPVTSDILLQAPSKSVTWKFPETAIKFVPENIQGQNMVTLSALTAMVQNLGDGKGVLISNPNSSTK